MNRNLLPTGVRTLHRLQKEMDHLFGGLFNQPGTASATVGGPAVNVWEKGDGFVIEAELPGFLMNELDITVEGAELVLRGERKAVSPSPESTVHRRERWYGKFERRLEFPVELDAERAEATLKDGVLTLSVPKSPAAAARKINIKSA